MICEATADRMECIVTSYNISPQACDQCYISKVKCTKDLPSCSVCAKRRKGCTYSRNLKKKLDFTVERTSSEDSNLFIVYAFDRDNNKSDNGSKVSSSCSSRKNSEPLVLPKNIKLTETTMKQFDGLQKPKSLKKGRPKIKKKDGEDTYEFTGDIFKPKYGTGSLIPVYAANIRHYKPAQVSRKNSFRLNEIDLLKDNQPLMCFTAGSSWTGYFMKMLSDVNYDVLIAIQFKIKYELPILIKLPENIPRLESLSTDQFSCINELVVLHRRAFLAYFKHINDYVPLFFQASFFLKNRSPLLIAAIAISGLRFLDPDPTVTKLIDYYQKKFLHLVKPHRVKVSLDYLQALLVAYMGFRGLGLLLKLNWLCPGLVSDIAHQLGLHLTNPSLKKLDKVYTERDLAYSAIVYHDCLKTLTVDIPGLSDMSHSSLFTYPSNILIDRLLPINKLLVIHSQFNFYQARAVQKFARLRFQASTNILSNNSLAIGLRKLMKGYHADLTTCLHQITLILKTISDCDEISRFKLFINHLHVEFYYIYLQAYTAYFTHVCEGTNNDSTQLPKTSSPPLSTSPTYDIQDPTVGLNAPFNGFQSSLRSSFAACVQLIDICATFSSDHSYHERLIPLTYALVFLIRRWKLFSNSPKVRSAVQRGIDHFRHLSSAPYFRARVVLALTFIEQLATIYHYQLS